MVEEAWNGARRKGLREIQSLPACVLRRLRPSAERNKARQGASIGGFFFMFTNENLGETLSILGCHVTRDRNAETLTFDQLLEPFARRGG